MKPRLQVFSRDDSDDEESSAPANDIARVNAQLAKRSSVIAPVIVGDDDPSIYDYDGAYDSFKAPDKVTHQLSQASSSSREAPVRITFAAFSSTFLTVTSPSKHHIAILEIALCEQSAVHRKAERKGERTCIREEPAEGTQGGGQRVRR